MRSRSSGNATVVAEVAVDNAHQRPYMPYIQQTPTEHGEEMAAVARLELRIDPEQKRLIEQAAAAEHQSVSAFVVETLVQRARSVVSGRAPGPRPIGGWSFALPEGWDAPLEDFAEWR